jgi:hypothetical protein
MYMKYDVELTYDIKRLCYDLSDILEDIDAPENADAAKIISLIQLYAKTKGYRRQEKVAQQVITAMGDLSMHIDFEPGDLFDETEPLTVQLTASNTKADFDIDLQDQCLSMNLSISFTMKTRIEVTEESHDIWEREHGGLGLPALSGFIGEYACDSGSSINWPF